MQERDAPGREEDFGEADDEGDIVMRSDGEERTPRERVGAEESREDAQRREREEEEERQRVIDKVLKRAEIAKVSVQGSCWGQDMGRGGTRRG